MRRALLLSVLLTLGISTAAPAAAAPPVSATAGHAAAAAPTTGWRFIDLPSHDGVVLKANIISPATAGPHPAIVFISSWGLNDAEYLAQAKILAQRGYVVLSYTARGFWGSGGYIDTAGPADIADVSAAIDWLTANTTADPDRVGVGGVSYGGGIALIAAGHDRRIRAVSAMSAWTDLVASLMGGETRRPQGMWLLRALAQTVGRPSAEMTRLLADYFANRDSPAIRSWGARRSAATYLDRINANRPAVLLTTAYGETLFPPNQHIDFVSRLTVPRRLELAAGDHALVELTGLVGLPNHVWTSTHRWFDEHLAGIDTGIADEPLVLRVRNAPGVVESYPDWTAVGRSTTRYHLGDVTRLDRVGPLSTGQPAAPGWTERFRAAGDTVAGGGTVLLSGGLEVLTGAPRTAWLPAVDRSVGALWSTPVLAAPTSIRGIARLRLTVRPEQPIGTVVAYLYDVDAAGWGKLVSHAPSSWTGAEAGAPRALDIDLPATAWNVPAGHRLALVVDTKDPLYLDTNSRGAGISVGGPSWLDLPTR